MNRLLSQLESGAENCVLEDWLGIHDSPDEYVRIVRMNHKCDPLGDATFPGIAVHCIAAFTADGDVPATVYFWAEDMGVLNYNNLADKSTILALLRLGVVLGGVSASGRPNLPSLSTPLKAELEAMFAHEQDYLADKHLYWMEYDNLIFVALFSESDLNGFISTESILHCIGFHNDYFRIKSPVWNSVPMAFLFGLARESAVLVAKLLLEPKCFNPFVAAPPGWFLWPWQQSLAKPADGSAVRYTPIATTSLVFDLRKSTMALEQLRDEDVGLFSDFIKSVVAAAKKAVFDHGGFFDKETGDGVVAHFCDFDLPGADIEPAGVRAFRAARTLIGSIHSICDAFQKRLKMGVGGLGASVGLYSDKAVWICEKNLVSAYGESVIMAARLCAEAEIGSIFVSNHEFEKLALALPPEEVSGFERRSYLGKEYNQGSQLFGYHMQVSPSSAVRPNR